MSSPARFYAIEHVHRNLVASHAGVVLLIVHHQHVNVIQDGSRQVRPLAVGYEGIQFLVVQAALAVGHVPRPCRPVSLLATEKRIAHILQIQIEPEAHAVFLAQGIDSSQTTALACIVRVLEYLKRIFRVRAVSSIAEYPVICCLHQQLAIVLTIPFWQIVEIHILYKVVKPIQYVF